MHSSMGAEDLQVFLRQEFQVLHRNLLTDLKLELDILRKRTIEGIVGGLHGNGAMQTDIAPHLRIRSRKSDRGGGPGASLHRRGHKLAEMVSAVTELDYFGGQADRDGSADDTSHVQKLTAENLAFDLASRAMEEKGQSPPAPGDARHEGALQPLEYLTLPGSMCPTTMEALQPPSEQTGSPKPCISRKQMATSARAEDGVRHESSAHASSPTSPTPWLASKPTTLIQAPVERPGLLDMASRGMAGESRSKQLALEEAELENMHAARRVALRIVADTRFEILFLILIMASSVWIGVQVDFLARSVRSNGSHDPEPPWFRYVDITFGCVFTGEVVLRLLVFKLSFFYREGWLYNVFDFCLVLFQILEEILQVFYGSDDVVSAAGVLRIVRILRAARVIGVVRLMRYAPTLRLMVSCLIQCLGYVFWAMVLLSMMSYIVGIYLTQITYMSRVARSRIDAAIGSYPDVEKDLVQWFGNVPQSLLSLVQGITGGCDWNDLVQPLMRVSDYAGPSLVLYICVAILAVMNIVTGIFVESVVDRARDVKQLQLLSKARSLFEGLDLDSSGMISLTDILRHQDRPAVRALFKEMDIDTADCSALVELLDKNECGELSLADFLHGCARLQEGLKVMDMVAMANEMRRDSNEQRRLLLDMGSRLDRLTVFQKRNGVDLA